MVLDEHLVLKIPIRIILFNDLKEDINAMVFIHLWDISFLPKDLIILVLKILQELMRTHEDRWTVENDVSVLDFLRKLQTITKITWGMLSYRWLG